MAHLYFFPLPKKTKKTQKGGGNIYCFVGGCSILAHFDIMRRRWWWCGTYNCFLPYFGSFLVNVGCVSNILGQILVHYYCSICKWGKQQKQIGKADKDTIFCKYAKFWRATSYVSIYSRVGRVLLGTS
jgi:hypothetical protein